MKDPCLAISLSPCGSLAPALVCRKGRESWAAFIEREDRFERPARRERERESGGADRQCDNDELLKWSALAIIKIQFRPKFKK